MCVEFEDSTKTGEIAVPPASVTLKYIFAYASVPIVAENAAGNLIDLVFDPVACVVPVIDIVFASNVLIMNE